MRDYRRIDFIARMRALFPDVFRNEDDELVDEENILSTPSYLREDCVVLYTSKPSDHILDGKALCALESFVERNGIDIQLTSAVKSYKSLRLNSFQIRTQASEHNLLTSDSLVCLRWLDGDVERYARFGRCYDFFFVYVPV